MSQLVIHDRLGQATAQAQGRQGHHQRELFSPKRVAVRPFPLGHDNALRPSAHVFAKNLSCAPMIIVDGRSAASL
jgi:hypothetical protein